MSADSIVPGAGSLTLSPHDAVASGMWGKPSGGPGNPQDLNRYSYGLNNPVRNTDPSGHFAWVLGAAAIGAVVNVGLEVGFAAVTGQLQTMDSGQIATMVAEAAVVGAVAGGVSALAGPAAGSAVAAAVGTRVGAAAVNLVGKTIATGVVEGGISFVGSMAGETLGNAVNFAVTGNAELPSPGQEAALTGAESGAATFSTINSGVDTVGDMNHHMRQVTVRGDQAIPRALANQ